MIPIIIPHVEHGSMPPLTNTFPARPKLVLTLGAKVVRGNKLVRALSAPDVHVILTTSYGAHPALMTLLTPISIRSITVHVPVEKNHHAGLVFIRPFR